MQELTAFTSNAVLDSTPPILKGKYDKKGLWKSLNPGDILLSSLEMSHGRCAEFMEMLL